MSGSDQRKLVAGREADWRESISDGALQRSRDQHDLRLGLPPRQCFRVQFIRQLEV